MIYALVFVAYLAIMFLPNFIMIVIEHYSYHVRAEKDHNRQLDRMGYFKSEEHFNND